MRHGRVIAVLSALVLSLVLLFPFSVFAACGDDPGDAVKVAAARAQVEQDCHCATAANHGDFVRCAADVARQRARDRTLPPACKGRVKKCAARSTCGKPGFVTCCRTDALGATKCATRSDASRCVAPAGGSACVGHYSSCCDACTTGGCTNTTTTTSTTHTTTTTVPPTTCHRAAASGECTGTCDEAGTQCLVNGSGACVCSARVCGQCYLTVTDTCYLSACDVSDDCGPNGFCGGVFFHECPAMECPCCPICGDGICDPDEDIAPCKCVADCGGTGCTPDPASCGNFECERSIGERRETCPRDCGYCVSCQ